jgi:hypothetical protein
MALAQWQSLDTFLSERDWNGLDDLPGGESLAVRSNHSLALLRTPNGKPWLIAGQYDTGTNLLKKLLRLNFPEISAAHVPQQYEDREPTQEWIHQLQARDYFWKHTKPSNIKPDVAERYSKDGVVVLVMVRDPLSWLQSMKKEAYDLNDCARRPTWLTAPCTTRPFFWEQGLRVPQPAKEFSSLMEIWNEWTRDYEHMHDFGFANAVVIRYEDLVLNTEEELNKVARALALPEKHSISQVVQAAKNHGHSLNRDGAVDKLKGRSYLKQYTDEERREVCDRLDKKLLSDYDYTDCDELSSD